MRLALFFGSSSLFLVLLAVNLVLARRIVPLQPVLLSALLPEGDIAALRRLATLLLVAGAVLAAFLFGAAFAGQWDTILLWLNAESFGATEEAFGRDVSFYVFTLPALEFIQSWGLAVAVVITIFTALSYAYSFGLRRFAVVVPRAVKVHLSLLLVVILGLFTWGYWLDRFGLALSENGAVLGATFTDLHARLPALYILMAMALLAALLIVANTFRKGLLLPALGLGGWLLAVIVAGNIYPAILQRTNVQPNEFEKEQVYIQRNMDFTRLAYGLDNVVTNEFASEPVVSAEAILRNADTLQNVRLWDHRPLRQTYNQLQTLRPQYIFSDVDVDRYVINGEYRQVMLGARELSPTRVAAESPGWINGRLKFTHGYGLAMSPVTEFSEEGRPTLFVKDLPVSGELTVSRPQIYYGERTGNYVIVNSKEKEFDFVSEFETTYTSHGAEGGILLDSFIRRLVYAWELADINILISGQITDESRLLIRRNIQGRINEIAPFLWLDSDPYLVVLEPTADEPQGRLIWIQDAYTVTNQFPYSQRLAIDFNYIRNSVKVVVDAYTGQVTFYIVDPDDPIVRTYAKIFPDLFTPEGEIPDSIRAHLRYPEDLFRLQVEVHLTYHIERTEDLYQKNDLWAVPTETFISNEQEVLPYYVIMRLPGESEAEFLLILPVTPAGRRNAIAWIAGRSDGEHLGELVVYQFQAGIQIDGPSQVESRIDQDTVISPQLTLLGQEGSELIRGNLLMIPIEDSIMYIEPVYLQAEINPFPELKRVIAVNGNRIVMEPTLEQALAKVIDATPAVQPAPTDPPPAPTTPEPTPTPTPVGGTEDIAALVREAQEAYDSAQQALRDGDFAGYGAQIQRLEQLLDQLAELTSQEEGSQ